MLSQHIWSDNNPLCTTPHKHQQEISENIWANVLSDFLVGPYTFPDFMAQHAISSWSKTTKFDNCEKPVSLPSETAVQDVHEMQNNVLTRFEAVSTTSAWAVAYKIGISQSGMWRIVHEECMHPYHMQKMQSCTHIIILTRKALLSRCWNEK